VSANASPGEWRGEIEGVEAMAMGGGGGGESRPLEYIENLKNRVV
jgi:hypothetical protein